MGPFPGFDMAEVLAEKGLQFLKGRKLILVIVMALLLPLLDGGLRDPLIQSSQVIVVIHDFRFERSRSLHVPILEA